MSLSQSTGTRAGSFLCLNITQPSRAATKCTFNYSLTLLLPNTQKKIYVLIDILNAATNTAQISIFIDPIPIPSLLDHSDYFELALTLPDL